MESKGLKTWIAVKKYLNLYHHQTVKEDVELKTVEGMPIDTIENGLKALEIIRNHSDLTTLEIKKRPAYTEYLLVIGSLGKKVITKEEYDLLKEVLL